MYHPFSVSETIRIAWHILKKNFSTIAVYTLLAFVIIVGTGFVVDYIISDVILESVEVIFSILLVSFIFLGFIKLVFQLIDKEYYDFEFKDILPQIKMLLSYIILLVIVSTVYVFLNQAIKNMEDGIVQHLLGILAAVFVEIFFLFYFPICACFIVDDNSGPFESVAQSFNLIKGNFLKYLLLFVFIEVLVFVGTLTVIGIIFAVPFVNILLVVAYRKLVYSHLDVDDDVTETV
ncbi:MAG TPA: hypothetical protein VNX40_02020 [Mucilaginibacter sp.]|jgi:uncharacterized membrane protein|nr:hypothetical protein [Mucilaginibacter sp.]